ncbi:MAG: hypothetical protein Q9191_005895 [Dirinaria sp. TL-2023a]
MTFRQEFASWLGPAKVPTSSPPSIGSPAPSITSLTFPHPSGRPTILTFLRHCGCPFAEKTFLRLRSAATSHPSTQFIAVSHSSRASTDQWLSAVGGAGPVHVLVDEERKIYAAWGLGVAGWWHVLNPAGLWNVYKLGKDEGIWNRPTESGSRWQMSGSFGVDSDGIVSWGQTAPSADWIPDFEEAANVVKGY